MSRAQIFGYIGVILACFAAGLLAGLTPISARIDNAVYDYTARAAPSDSWTPKSVVVAVDEATLQAHHGMRNVRSILAEALDAINRADPKVVALDVTLPDDVDPVEDARLADAFRATHNLILPSKVLANGKWEDPSPRFKPFAAAIGHAHPEQDRSEGDGVSRYISLEISADHQRRWALALEAFRAWRGDAIMESPTDLQLGATVIPASRSEGGRRLMLRYLPAGTIPTVSVLDLEKHPDLLHGKVVFLGVTALDAAVDRLVNPYGENVSGVEVHAQAFETLARGQYFTHARDGDVLLLSLAYAAAVGLLFAFLQGWPAYLPIFGLIAFAHWLPFEFYRQLVILPYVAPVAVVWLASAGAATYQQFFVRRQLRRSESEKTRYQQAIHWAAHEMRTPLTAIQGSSEIMARYNLPDNKRHELSEMINSESKRLSRIIQTFLDMERIAEGQMEMKREPFEAGDLVESCLRRVKPLAERKNIRIFVDSDAHATLVGDRELMEYALYNLLTNAVKYSPADTEVHIRAEHAEDELRLAVVDQGMGMDSKELQNIFKKFYRTKRAEASGEVGTGIGLSIVEQIVHHHGGRIDVSSTPGKGSCFTMVMRINSEKNGQAVSRRR